MPRSRARRTIDSCRRKIRYAEEPPTNAVVRPYHCDNCGGWHMTTRPAFEAREIMKRQNEPRWSATVPNGERQ
jgi:hypothetical protein